MKDYPKILQRSSKRSIRFGNLPINPDFYAKSPIGTQYGQIINGRGSGVFRFDYIPYDLNSFTRLFWNSSQLKIQFLGYIKEEKDKKIISLKPAEEKDLKDRNININRIALGVAGEGIGRGASKNRIQYAQRYARNFRIQKKGYLNKNFLTSIVLSKRVIIPEFAVKKEDEENKKITLSSLKFTNYINQIEYDKIQTDLGNADFTHPNHLMSGGPLITNTLQLALSKTNNIYLALNLYGSPKRIKDKSIEKYYNNAKKILEEEKKEFSIRKSIDKQVQNKQEDNQKVFLDNLEKNIQGFGRGIYIDCSSYFFRPKFSFSKKYKKIQPDREDYVAKKNNILSEYIKKRRTNVVYHPFVYIFVNGGLSATLTAFGVGASNYGMGTPIGEVLIPWREEAFSQEQQEKDKNLSKASFEEEEAQNTMYPVKIYEDDLNLPTLVFKQQTFNAFPAPWGQIDYSNFDIQFAQTLKLFPIKDVFPGGGAEIFFKEKDVPHIKTKNII